ncbi:hypothetical protein KPA07_08895 [Corynebacterium aurimucosum]|uniref:hypothetical protein n=1 Tax=Corynebacterium aurimucosum TaxID=169292 RepID=UPI001C0E9280|nr:hypothetical protein [Corynebacterium aurimucosum]MBU5655019.1 hypothetical protein [Corynebacterium aurimucosum]
MSIQHLNEAMQELKANMHALEAINQQCQNCTPSEYQRLDRQALRIMRANNGKTLTSLEAYYHAINDCTYWYRFQKRLKGLTPDAVSKSDS